MRAACKQYNLHSLS